MVPALRGREFNRGVVCSAEFAVTFLPRSKHLLISWLLSPSAVILEPQKIKSDPSIRRQNASGRLWAKAPMVGGGAGFVV